MKILAEVPFNKSICVGDTVTIYYEEHGGDVTVKTKVCEHMVTEGFECTHASVIELENEGGYKRAFGGIFGVKE